MNENTPDKKDDRDDVPPDNLLGALANKRRLYIIEYLANHEEGTLKDLTDHIIKIEGIEDPNAVSAGLYHKELPRLKIAKIVDWSPDEENIKQGTEFHRAYSLKTSAEQE